VIKLSELKVKEKEIVVPGDVLAEGMEYLPAAGTYRENDKIIASRLGLVNVDRRLIKIIPLTGRYLPKKNDIIVGRVTDITIGGWRLDINSAYSSMLSMKDATSDFIRKGEDLTRWFAIGDYMVTKIVNVTSQNLVDLTMRGPGLRKVKGGRILAVNCNKVPRIIGKGGSMVGLIKKATDCNIIVGQNGFVWVSGNPESEALAEVAIRMIEDNSHVSGLTEAVKDFLEKKTGRKLEIGYSNEGFENQGHNEGFENHGPSENGPSRDMGEHDNGGDSNEY
jgi:exosome complex component RRP4